MILETLIVLTVLYIMFELMTKQNKYETKTLDVAILNIKKEIFTSRMYELSVKMKDLKTNKDILYSQYESLLSNHWSNIYQSKLEEKYLNKKLKIELKLKKVKRLWQKEYKNLNYVELKIIKELDGSKTM